MRQQSMANNLFISYDLNSSGQDYSAVIEEIKNLGNWANLQKSLWYVSSSLTASQVADRLWARMDRNDSLIVINATDNASAWRGISEDIASFIKDKWSY